MTTVAIIPARGGSKSIPMKNVALVGGKPLVHWTLKALEESRMVDYGLLSSDSDDILSKALPFTRCDPLPRPRKLATDEATTESVIAHALEGREADIIVLLQPTSPIRTGKQIDEAVNLLLASGADSVVSVTRSHYLLWERDGDIVFPLYEPDARPRRQEMCQYNENGSIYVFTRDIWERAHNRIGGKVALYEMDEASGLQIDTPFDLVLVEAALQHRVSAVQ